MEDPGYPIENLLKYTHEEEGTDRWNPTISGNLDQVKSEKVHRAFAESDPKGDQIRFCNRVLETVQGTCRFALSIFVRIVT